LTKAWPTKLETETDLAGFLRRRLEQEGGGLQAFKTAERFLKDILSDWRDPYEIAVVYDRVIASLGASDKIWNLLDLRAYARFRRSYAPVQGTAHYTYIALFGATGPQRAQIFDLVEELEDALLVRDKATEKRLREELDGIIRGVCEQP